jgi:hypothetical protein
MRAHVMRRICFLMCMAVTAACGGVDPTEADQVGEPGVPPTAEAVSNNVSAILPDGCGAFKQRCCTNYVCNTGLECDPASGTCLY